MANLNAMPRSRAARYLLRKAAASVKAEIRRINNQCDGTCVLLGRLWCVLPPGHDHSHAARPDGTGASWGGSQDIWMPPWRRSH